MERMLIFYMLFFCSSVALTVAPHKTAKYKQLLKTIPLLESTVKDKDVELLHTPENPVNGCLSTAVTCFQKGLLKLQPENSQVNATFTQTVRLLKRFTLNVPGEVGFPKNAHNLDHCSSFSTAETTCNAGIVESKLVRKNSLPLITLEKKNFQLICVSGRGVHSDPINCTDVFCKHVTCRTKGQRLRQKNMNESCHCFILSLSDIAGASAFPFVKGFDYNPLNFSVRKLEAITYDADVLFRSGMIFFIFQQCESSCESYKKKSPKEFLKSFEKLIKKVIAADSSWALCYFANNDKYSYFPLFLTKCCFYSY